MTTYADFLRTKHVRVQHHGFDVDAESLNPLAFDWQRQVVAWWLKLGRAAGFEDCGLGKTLQELLWAERIIRTGHGTHVLILAPPAVAAQTLREAEKFGITVDTRVCRDGADVRMGINITNYERLHRFDCQMFNAVVLDESSILKSYMGKTKQKLLREFRDTPYRLAATATPAPNDHLELGNHAEFLGVMRANEMLARWFINDTSSAGNYRLKGHAEDDYWRWMASWAVSVGRPSDLGSQFSDDGYVLPRLEIHEQCIDPEWRQLDAKPLSAIEIHRAKRANAPDRAERAAVICSGLGSEPCVIWCDTNYEADALRAVMADAIEVRGSDSIEIKEERLTAFTEGQITRLITKPDIAGFGLNWQHCCHTIFAGVSDSYERFYQAIRRLYRFGQWRPVHCHLVYGAAERPIISRIHAKADKHELMKSKMGQYMGQWQQQNLSGSRPLAKTNPPVSTAGDGYTLWHGDCVDVAAAMPAESVGFCIHSPPFSNLYIYSDSQADLGNSRDHGEFFRHYEYLIDELFRVTIPGRLCAVHCKDLPLYRGRDGAAGLYDFPGQITAAFERRGWTFHSRVTIWKDPVTEMQRTKSFGLLHRQLCKDSCASRQGMADYLLVFRKWSDCDEFPDPVSMGNRLVRFTGYVGEAALPQHVEPLDEAAVRAGQVATAQADPYSIAVWQRYASPVWFDIRQMRVLNYRLGRDDKDEKHICPLQLDVIERAVHLWTNPGDLVYDPFMGIGSSAYVALKLGRRAVGSELKESYHRLSIENCELALRERQQEKQPAQPLLPIFAEAEQSQGTAA